MLGEDMNSNSRGGKESMSNVVGGDVEMVEPPGTSGGFGTLAASKNADAAEKEEGRDKTNESWSKNRPKDVSMLHNRSPRRHSPLPHFGAGLEGVSEGGAGGAKDIQFVVHMVTVPLILLATVATGVALIFLKDILVPFVIAFFFVNLLRPLIKVLTTPIPCCCCASLAKEIEYREKIFLKKDDELRKCDDIESARLLELASAGTQRCVTPGHEGKGSTMQCPHWLAVLLSLLIVCGMMSLIVISLASTMKGITSVKPSEIEAALLATSNTTFAWFKENFDVDGATIVKQFVEEIKVSEMIQYAVNTLTQSMLDTLMVLLIVLYLLFEESFGNERTEFGSFKQKIDSQIQQYIALKTLVSIFIGIAVYIILGPLLHVDFALLLGVMTFLLNFIPNLGAFFATFVTPLTMVLDNNAYSSADYILAIALPTACHTIVGNVVEPALFGKSLEIHPIIVLLALAFWYALWGVTGAILAVPITAVLRIAAAETDHPYAKFLHNILEGRLPRGWSKALAGRSRRSHIHEF